jgi:hypothetical protein
MLSAISARWGQRPAYILVTRLCQLTGGFLMRGRSGRSSAILREADIITGAEPTAFYRNWGPETGLSATSNLAAVVRGHVLCLRPIFRRRFFSSRAGCVKQWRGSPIGFNVTRWPEDRCDRLVGCHYAVIFDRRFPALISLLATHPTTISSRV